MTSRRAPKFLTTFKLEGWLALIPWLIGVGYVIHLLTWWM